MTEFNEIFKASRQASKALADKTDAQLSQVLVRLSGLVRANIDYLIRENSRDLERMDKDNPLYDRLQLTAPRLEAIADDLVSVSKLPSPVGEEVEHRTLANGIDLRQVRVPYGVIGVIYEARPNVTFDVFSLCLRTGNACVLKGGRDAEYSNLAAIKLIHQALREEGFPEAVATLLPSTHEATAALLGAVGYVDLCIRAVAADSSTSCVTMPVYRSSRPEPAWSMSISTPPATLRWAARLSTMPRHVVSASVTRSIPL